MPCSNCGSNDFEDLWQGACYAVRCVSCGREAVATKLPPFVADRQIYSVLVTSLGVEPSKALIAINHYFTQGIVRTKQLFETGGEVCRGMARQVLPVIRALVAAGAVVTTQPSFPYDVSNPLLETEHEHGWQPVAQATPN